MKSALPTLTIALLLLAGLLPLAGARQATRREPAGASQARPEEVRKRWEALSPADQARMRERWERYQALPEEERRELAERSRRMQSLRERVERQIPAPQRERWQSIPASQRQQLLREMVEGETERVGARMRELLPPEVVHRLEQARPEDRARYFAKFQRAQRERVTRYMLEKLGARLALASGEIERLKALPEEDRARETLELRKRLTSEEARLVGLPPGLTQAQWDEWLALPPEEFFERLGEHVRQRRLAGVETDPRPRTDTGGPARPRQERLRALRRLQDVLHPGPQDYVELADLAPAERRQRVVERVRERGLALLAQGGLASEESLRELRGLPPERFRERVQAVITGALRETER